MTKSKNLVSKVLYGVGTLFFIITFFSFLSCAATFIATLKANTTYAWSYLAGKIIWMVAVFFIGYFSFAKAKDLSRKAKSIK